MKQHTSHIVIALVAVAFFMEYIDSTALVTALPQMAADFGVESGRMSIGITAYMISLAVFIPVSGWVADRYGTRSVFAYAVLGFIGTSDAVCRRALLARRCGSDDGTCGAVGSVEEL